MVLIHPLYKCRWLGYICLYTCCSRRCWMNKLYTDLCLVIIPPLAIIVLLLLIPLCCWLFLPVAGVGVACGFVEVVHGHFAVSCYVALLTTSVASLCWGSLSFACRLAVSFAYVSSFVGRSFVWHALSNLSFACDVHVAISLAFVAFALSFSFVGLLAFAFVVFSFASLLTAPLSIGAGPP